MVRKMRTTALPSGAKALVTAFLALAVALPTLASPVVYEGQVTRIDYPDSTSEIFGYDAGEQLDWRYSQDGRYTELVRDALHRVTQVVYPATSGYGAITVTTQFDEFGRVEQTSDGNGTSTFTYDDLNRLKTATPAIGQGVTYTYTPDVTNKRWTTAVALSGVGTWQFGEDSKGRIAEVLNPHGQYTSRQFDPDGKLTKETKANGTVSNYSYTTRGWLAGIEHRLASGTVLDNFQYYYTTATGTYDSTGKLRREIDAGGRVHSFDYKSGAAIMRETHPDFGQIDFTTDLNGNHTRRKIGTVDRYHGYDAHNKLLWVNATNVAPISGQANPYRRYNL
jgi:YD repeat-containing protein